MKKIIATITLCSIIFSTQFVYGENEQVDLEKKLTENRDSQLRLDEQIIELNSKIKEIEEKISLTNEEINELDLQIDDIKSEINELENNIKNNKEQLAKRIKVINSNYSMSYIKILLNSSSISDFLNNMYIVKQIVPSERIFNLHEQRANPVMARAYGFAYNPVFQEKVHGFVKSRIVKIRRVPHQIQHQQRSVRG